MRSETRSKLEYSPLWLPLRGSMQTVKTRLLRETLNSKEKHRTTVERNLVIFRGGKRGSARVKVYCNANTILFFAARTSEGVFHCMYIHEIRCAGKDYTTALFSNFLHSIGFLLFSFRLPLVRSTFSPASVDTSIHTSSHEKWNTKRRAIPDVSESWVVARGS